MILHCLRSIMQVTKFTARRMSRVTLVTPATGMQRLVPLSASLMMFRLRLVLLLQLAAAASKKPIFARLLSATCLYFSCIIRRCGKIECCGRRCDNDGIAPSRCALAGVAIRHWHEIVFERGGEPDLGPDKTGRTGVVIRILGRRWV